MGFYDEMQAVASELLAEFKQGVVQLVQSTPGTGPIDNPGDGTTTTTDLDAVVKGVSYKYLRDANILTTDLQVIAAIVPDITPTPNDFIIIDGISHKIVQDISTPASDVRAVWKWIVRKGPVG